MNFISEGDQDDTGGTQTQEDDQRLAVRVKGGDGQGTIISPAFQRLQSGQSTPSREPSRSPLSQILHEEDLFNDDENDGAGAKHDDQLVTHFVDATPDATPHQEGRGSGGLRDAAVVPSARPKTPDAVREATDLAGRSSLNSSPSSSSQMTLPRPKRPGSLQPFDRRFSSQRNFATSPRASPPAFVAGHSRQSSMTSFRFSDHSSMLEADAPWEVMRWVKLRKLAGSVFSEAGKRSYGRPTCMAVANQIAVGTSRGLVLVFDYQQTLIATIGIGTKAVEAGSVTSLAISADHSTVASGHQNGDIFTWEIERPARAFLHIPSSPAAPLGSRVTEGHLHGKAVLHVSFLGTRHTALVSADDGGMAFSHLASRGLGSVARVVKTVRLLGRYPEPSRSGDPPRRASSVLAFGALPLGNVEQTSDTVGLTALLTPYLLVIVSTTPIAQTQYKSPRPKEVKPHSTLSGCLAWFPAVRLKNSTPGASRAVSKTKLVYCWSNVLTILDVDTILSRDEDKPPEFTFRPRSRWTNDEAIVAVQWLSRSVLALLTISQRLVILEDNELRVTDSYDLLHKHIFHHDLFSEQLRPVVEQLDEEDTSLHGVVADAFYMSFRAYKGRLFLLGFESVEMGTLSNWSDRLLALMEEGSYVAAIELGTRYYSGQADKLTVGLPEDAETRHDLVRDRLLELISTSIKFLGDGTAVVAKSEETNDQVLHHELISASFVACMDMEEHNFLFDEVYSLVEDAGLKDIFFETLEPYILDQTITSVAPGTLQRMINTYASKGSEARLEEILCQLDATTLDIDHSLTLCKQHQLLDALIHVYNRALRDFVSPLTEFLRLIVIFASQGVPEPLEAKLSKIFPYLAFCLTSRYFPSNDTMDEEVSRIAKSDIYRFVFSGRAVEWPPGSGVKFLGDPAGSDWSEYPYLSRILQFDTSSFLSVLNEAFEDGFLNGDEASVANGAYTNGFSPTQASPPRGLPTRQSIISILLEVMAGPDFTADDTIYLDMFIARNLPKFPQFIMLPGSSIHKILQGLCRYPAVEHKEDCELSVEYLLSQYHPTDLRSLIPLLEEAGFYRVLKLVYAGEKEYAKLLETCFADTDSPESIFVQCARLLHPEAGLTAKQLQEVQAVILSHAQNMVAADSTRSAQILAIYAPDLFEQVLEKLEYAPNSCFAMLESILEPDQTGQESLTNTKWLKHFEDQYIQLMCKFKPDHVADYVGTLESSDLHLDQIIPAMESSGVVDAVIVLIARKGMARQAMMRLVKHLTKLSFAMTSLFTGTENENNADIESTLDDLLQAIHKYSKVGIWLCQGQSRASSRDRSSNRKLPDFAAPFAEADLELDEQLWLELIDCMVAISKDVGAAASSDDNGELRMYLSGGLRPIVQTLFSALLASTTSLTASSPDGGEVDYRAKNKTAVLESYTADHGADSIVQDPTEPNAHEPLTGGRFQSHSNPSFLIVLRAFLSRASARLPTLSDLRAVLVDIFSAYSFEAHMLELTNRFLDKDVFGNVVEGHERRVMGWRPSGPTCAVCGKRAWGPGTGGGVWDAWDDKSDRDAKARRIKLGVDLAPDNNTKGKGKGREVMASDPSGGNDEVQPRQGALVIFACGHSAHKECLERVDEQARRTAEDEHNDEGVGTAYKCPIHN